MLDDNYFFFNIFNLLFKSVINNYLIFTQFITNYKAISHVFKYNKYEKKRNIEDNFYDNINELFVKCISEQY